MALRSTPGRTAWLSPSPRPPHARFRRLRGNRQYISTGNVDATGKACLFLMDYVRQQRLKIWAEARIVDLTTNPELIEQLNPDGYGGVAERAFLFTVMAYDWNCPQHITPRYTKDEIAAGLAEGKQ